MSPNSNLRAELPALSHGTQSTSVGVGVGDSVGGDVGIGVGDSVGTGVGKSVGASVGVRVGSTVGANVTIMTRSVSASTTVSASRRLVERASAEISAEKC